MARYYSRGELLERISKFFPNDSIEGETLILERKDYYYISITIKKKED